MRLVLHPTSLKPSREKVSGESLRGSSTVVLRGKPLIDGMDPVAFIGLSASFGLNDSVILSLKSDAAIASGLYRRITVEIVDGRLAPVANQQVRI